MATIATLPRMAPTLGVAALFRAVSGRISLRNQRARLITLDDQQLRDIGVTYIQALKESRRPVWNVPSNWLRPSS
ncbi:MAG: DUF1127 domain-containing protein [Alphaproteobacteria bacterium]|nr:DUF1127 domain-containing protein [Alphaproteobacteria bacterium]